MLAFIWFISYISTLQAQPLMYAGIAAIVCILGTAICYGSVKTYFENRKQLKMDEF